MTPSNTMTNKDKLFYINEAWEVLQPTRNHSFIDYSNYSEADLKSILYGNWDNIKQLPIDKQ